MNSLTSTDLLSRNHDRVCWLSWTPRNSNTYKRPGLPTLNPQPLGCSPTAYPDSIDLAMAKTLAVGIYICDMRHSWWRYLYQDNLTSTAITINNGIQRAECITPTFPSFTVISFDEPLSIYQRVCFGLSRSPYSEHASDISPVVYSTLWGSGYVHDPQCRQQILCLCS